MAPMAERTWDQADGEAFRTWLLGPAASLWLERGVDRTAGGYFDQLTFDSAKNSSDFKRLRVCARQIFVFSQLAEAGVTGAREAVLHGLDFLFGRLRHPDGGFIRSTTLTGAPLDTTRDLYDHAFVIFALAAADRLTGDGRMLTEACAVLDLIEDRMAHPAGGYAEGLPPQQPRRQNPHMHLLEACLAWLTRVDNSHFSRVAHELIGLFARKFLDKSSFMLFEFFEDDLSLHHDADTRVFEPGHHFEWVWLLGKARRSGLDVSGAGLEVARALAATAQAFGFAQETGLPFGTVRADGSVADGTCRIWVVTEWLRACLDEPASGCGSAKHAFAQLRRFTDVPVKGLWHERCDARSGQFSNESVPASSLYHIVSALAPVIGTETSCAGNKVAGACLM